MPAVVANKTGKAFKQSTSPQESIVDEVIDEAVDEVEDSIVDEVPEESGLSEKKSSDIKESIIRDEFESDNHKVSEAKQKIEARNRLRFGLASSHTDERPLDQMKKESTILAIGEQREQMALERQRVLGDLIGELNNYERAYISANAVDRLEKVLVSSMAQKDQLFMAQRLAELEAEKRH